VFLGKVVGTVWATQKEPKLEGAKFLIVRHIDLQGKLLPSYVVAVDAVGAGANETVLVASGSSARQTSFTEKKPVDAVIMAIVDRIDVP
jgi:microcompartment protein CcmK/EutM